MPKVIQVKDPFRPLESSVEREVPEGFHTNDFVCEGEKGLGFILYINNSRCVDGATLHSTDVAVFVPRMHGNLVIAIVVAIIIAAAVYFFMSAPGIPTVEGTPETDPTYTFKGQQNQLREGAPIEKFYGEGRHWPTYASRPYNQIIDNDQWYFGLFCVSLGPTTVTNIRIDDTLLSTYPGAESAVYQPGEKVTLFPTNVHTAVEVASIELLAPNEPGHDWSGGFAVVPSGFKTYKIEIDLSFRGGLYSTNSGGGLVPVTVTATFEKRLIDDAGAPLGGWVLAHTFTKTLSTVQPQRFTVSLDVTSGRYEIRGKRTTNKSADFKVRDALTWESARSYLEGGQNFGNVTLLAVKLRATNSLNDNSRATFNADVSGTAWTYSTLTESWSIQPTRNPIWVACDILLASYGRRLHPKMIHTEEIAALAAAKEAEGIFFDGVIDQGGTVWETIKQVLMSSKCVPDLPGTRFSIVEDKPLVLPSICLNGYNIIRNSVRINHSFPKEGAKDGLEVEYTDPVTWKSKTVMCKIGPDRGLNPERVKLPGCKSRTQAYRWGMYTRAAKVYGGTNVTVATGLEGETIRFGGLAAMQHDLLPTGETLNPEHTGRVTGDVVQVSGEDQMLVPVPFEFTFEVGKTYRISLRKRNGDMAGPFPCLESATPNTVILDSLIDASEINTVDGEEKATYFFGETGKDVHFFKIIRVEPGSQDSVQLTLTPYDERIYDFGDAEPPEEADGYSEPASGNTPVVTNLLGSSLPGDLSNILLSWTAALGAIDYVVETSLDNATWTRVGRTTSTSFTLPIVAGHIYTRVAGSSTTLGPWDLWDGNVGTASTVPYAAGTPLITQEFTGTALYLEVDPILLATQYVWTVKIGATQVYQTVTSSPTVSISSSAVKAGAASVPITLSRTLNISVKGRNVIGDGAVSDPVLTVTNPAPSAPTGLNALFAQVIGADSRYILGWDPVDDMDIEVYKIYSSTVAGFTPGVGNLISTTTAVSTEKLYATGVPIYWRVGAKDRWGDEVTLSAQSTFTP